MSIRTDYHMHTPRCKHAAGPMEAYIERGIALGLEEIGFSDHNPLPGGRGASVRMDEDELDDYVADVLRLRERYRGDIMVRLGLEMDYVADIEDYLGEQAARHPWDYIIGSVHYLDPQCQQGAWHREYPGGPVALYAAYFACMRRMVVTGFYDFVAHFDLPKRSGHPPTEEVEPLIEETLQAILGAGVGIEIITSGFRHGDLNEAYPGPAVVQRAIEMGIPLSVNSDSHAPDQVGTAFTETSELLRDLGCERLARYEGRQREFYPLMTSVG